jgi:predicted nucleic acid-binding protein
MVKAVFDTNILIDFLHSHPAARRELSLYEERAISVVTWMEVLVGAADEDVSRDFLSRFELLGVSDAVAEMAVKLRRVHRMKLPDAIIWATAKTQAALLVTRNTKDFPLDDPGVRVPYSLPPGVHEP